MERRRGYGLDDPSLDGALTPRYFAHWGASRLRPVLPVVIIVSLLVGPGASELLGNMEGPTMTGTSRVLLSAKSPNESADLLQPEIITAGVEQNVTAAKGTTAYLHCRVKNLGTRAVSWMRKRDLHVLTSGIFTYTSDSRFRAVQGGGYESTSRDEDWKLEIKSLKPEDEGLYECQVNTEPKIELLYRLIVTDLQVDILGQKPDIYVKEGSTLNLTCAIVSGGVNEPTASSHIQWLKDGVEIDTSAHPTSTNPEKWMRISQGIKNNVHSRHRAAKLAALRRFRRLKDAEVTSGASSAEARRTGYRRPRALTTAPTDVPSTPPTASAPIIVTKPKFSRLIVLRATKQDSGVYKCVPPHGNASRIFVHVIQGENSAAMQHGDPSGSTRTSSSYFLSTGLAMLYLVFFPFYACC